MSIFVSENMTNAELVRSTWGSDSLPVRLLSDRLTESDDERDVLLRRIEELQTAADKILPLVQSTLSGYDLGHQADLLAKIDALIGGLNDDV